MVRVVDSVVPVAHRRVAGQGLDGHRREFDRVEVPGTRADTPVVRACHATQVVGVVLLAFDVTSQVGAGVHGLQVTKAAAERPGRALVTILRESRGEGGDLVGRQGSAVGVGRVGVEIAVRVHVLVVLPNEQIPVIGELV